MKRQPASARKPRSRVSDPADRAADSSTLQSELESQLASTRRALEAFRDVAGALGAPVGLDHLLELVLERSAGVLDADRATLYLIDDATGELVSRFVVGGRVQTIRVAVGEGVAGEVVRMGKAIRVPDAYEDNRFNQKWDAVTGYRTHSILAVPMKSHLGQTIGVLQVLNKRTAEAFTDEDESLLGSLATQAAISIDNVKLFLSVVEKNAALASTQKLLERKVRHLKLLFDLESAMARAATQQDLVQSLLGQTVEATRTAAGAALLHDPERGEMLLFGLTEVNPTVLVQRPSVRPSGALGKAMRTRETVVSKRRTREEADELSGLDIKGRRVLAVPLIGDDGYAVGAIALYDRADGQPFGDDDAELLRLVAANASTAVSLLRSREAQQVSDRLSTIGRLLSSVLHDLKTPMAVISGYAQLLATTSSAKQRKAYVDLILAQFDHITAMQREVLAFARGERTLLVRKVYLQKFFEEFRAQLERELEGRPVKLDLILRDRGTARFDQAKVTRALHNLARNALEAMRPKGGTLTIVVDREGDDLVIDVADTGPGVPKQIESKLFQSFVTADKEEGTGLGLAIVKKVVEEHGGEVCVRSSARGAMFTLRIPQPGDV